MIVVCEAADDRGINLKGWITQQLKPPGIEQPLQGRAVIEVIDVGEGIVVFLPQANGKDKGCQQCKEKELVGSGLAIAFAEGAFGGALCQPGKEDAQ